MATRARDSVLMANSSAEMADHMVEVMARYQALGQDLQRLSDHLRAPQPKPQLGARILASMLSTAVLEEWLVRMQITAISEEARK
jgi:hypothetical protein